MSGDLAGRRVGHWRVLWRFHADPSWWECLCDCEGAVPEIVHEEDLLSGASRQCWDCERACRRGDLRGAVFGAWTVVARSFRDDARNWRWVAVCGCGHIGRPRDYDLRAGKSRRCGDCARRLRKESRKAPA